MNYQPYITINYEHFENIQNIPLDFGHMCQNGGSASVYQRLHWPDIPSREGSNWDGQATDYQNVLEDLLSVEFL